MNDKTDSLHTPTREFPTPDEIRAARVTASSKEIQAVLAAVEKHLLREGPGDISMSMPPAHIAEEVVRRLAASRWTASWFHGSGEGAEGLRVEATK